MRATWQTLGLSLILLSPAALAQQGIGIGQRGVGQDTTETVTHHTAVDLKFLGTDMEPLPDEVSFTATAIGGEVLETERLGANQYRLFSPTHKVWVELGHRVEGGAVELAVPRARLSRATVCLDLSAGTVAEVLVEPVGPVAGSGDAGDTPAPVSGSNNFCEVATAISGAGDFAFDTTGASTDGAPADSCDFFGTDQIDTDVWYCWTASCTGTVDVQTCGGTGIDTKIAVYDGCVCFDDIGPKLACNDDACGLQSAVAFEAIEGNQYLIRIGTFPGAATGGGTFSIEESDCPVGGGACCFPDGECAILGEDECGAEGGEYQGDGTFCEPLAVNDPGFERQEPAGPWTGSSHVFASPVCNEQRCGRGTGSGAHSGDGWAWFGGTVVPEESYLQQDVRIKQENRQLSFMLEMPAASGNGVDFLRVSVDGEPVLEIPESAAWLYTVYRQVTVDVSAFADGRDHTVRFDAMTTGSGPLGEAAPTSYFVDDVQIESSTTPLAICPTCITLDFETDDFGIPLGNGQDILTPDEFGNIVAIAGFGDNEGAAIFDSDPTGPNSGPSDYDHDLLVDLGNILILQGRPGQAVMDGFFDVPDDAEAGGALFFQFAMGVAPMSIDLIDLDPEPGDQSAIVTLYDMEGDFRQYTVPSGWTGDISVDGPPGYGTLDLTDLDDQPGFAATATATEGTLLGSPFDPHEVVLITVELSSSGALDNLEFCFFTYDDL